MLQMCLKNASKFVMIIHVPACETYEQPDDFQNHIRMCNA